MKLSLFTLLVGCAGAITPINGMRIGVASIAAAPLAPVPANGNSEAATGAHPGPIHHGVWTPENVPVQVRPKHRTKCGGMRAKALKYSSQVLNMFGFAKAEDSSNNDVAVASKVEVIQIVEVGAFAPNSPDGHGRPIRHHRHHGHHHGKHNFIERLTFALMRLGKWEGRAVAFVLGCGIGVLIRMAWVLLMLTARAVRGRRQEIELREDVNAIENPPVYRDEKEPVTEAKA